MGTAWSEYFNFQTIDLFLSMRKHYTALPLSPFHILHFNINLRETQFIQMWHLEPMSYDILLVLKT